MKKLYLLVTTLMLLAMPLGKLYAIEDTSDMDHMRPAPSEDVSSEKGMHHHHRSSKGTTGDHSAPSHKGKAQHAALPSEEDVNMHPEGDSSSVDDSTGKDKKGKKPAKKDKTKSKKSRNRS